MEIPRFPVDALKKDCIEELYPLIKAAMKGLVPSAPSIPTLSFRYWGKELVHITGMNKSELHAAWCDLEDMVDSGEFENNSDVVLYLEYLLDIIEVFD